MVAFVVTLVVSIVYHLKHKNPKDFEKEVILFFFYVFALLSTIPIITFIISNGKLFIFGKSTEDLYFPLAAGTIFIIANSYKCFREKIYKM